MSEISFSFLWRCRGRQVSVFFRCGENVSKVSFILLLSDDLSHSSEQGTNSQAIFFVYFVQGFDNSLKCCLFDTCR